MKELQRASTSTPKNPQQGLAASKKKSGVSLLFQWDYCTYFSRSVKGAQTFQIRAEMGIEPIYCKGPSVFLAQQAMCGSSRVLTPSHESRR